MFYFKIKISCPSGFCCQLPGRIDDTTLMVVSVYLFAQTNLIKAFTSIRVYIVSFLKLILIPAIVLMILTILPLDYEVKLTYAHSVHCSMRYGNNAFCVPGLAAILRRPAQYLPYPQFYVS